MCLKAEVTAWPSIPSHYYCYLVPKRTVPQVQHKQLAYPLWWLFASSSLQGAPVHTFLSSSMAATQIKLWEVIACVRVWTPALCLLCAVFPAATFAGATCELYSLSVIKILCKAILEPHTGFVMCLIVFVGVFLCHSVSVCICVCACLCVKQAKRGSCANGLRGPPTEALFSKQHTEKGWRSQTRRDTHHLRGDWCLSPSSSSFFCKTRRTSSQCPISPLLWKKGNS